MKQTAMITLCAFALSLAACASSPEARVEEAPAAAPISEPLVKPTEETSDVLAKKDPKAVKCPKRARLVKGKCILPVEETE